MSVMFEWWAVGAAAPIGSATVANVASGATAAVTVPAGAFADGGRYQWRVKAADGVSGSDSWSSFCEMTVYVTSPPAEGCAGGVDGDYNGDGVRDIAIADPEATVNGHVKAGLVRVIDGASGVVSTLHQDLAEVPGAAEPGDQFGFALATYDANRDGCSDLVVGVPFEDLDTVEDAGAVWVLLGSPQGLGKGPAALEFHQGYNGIADTREAGDWFGYAVAASHTATGEPYLVIGVPGEDIGAATDTGAVHYRRGTTNAMLAQGGAGIPGATEVDDRTGYAVTASTHHFAVGSPGEAIGAEVFAGFVNVFSHELVSGLPKLAASIEQNSTGVSDDAEANDTFGKSISLVPYRPAGSPAGLAESLLAVGVPGEDLDGVADAGMVQRFHIEAAGFSEILPALTQSTAGVSGDNGDGDYFGEKVVLVNRDPSAEATDQTLLLAVGAPGEDLPGAADAGEVHVLTFSGASVSQDTTIARGANRLPGSPRGQELLGLAMGTSSEDLYLGTPYREGAVYALEWATLATGGGTPRRVWRAGEGGIPAGEVAFGAVIG